MKKSFRYRNCAPSALRARTRRAVACSNICLPQSSRPSANESCHKQLGVIPGATERSPNFGCVCWPSQWVSQSIKRDVSDAGGERIGHFGRNRTLHSSTETRNCPMTSFAVSLPAVTQSFVTHQPEIDRIYLQLGSCLDSHLSVVV